LLLFLIRAPGVLRRLIAAQGLMGLLERQELRVAARAAAKARAA
jgi:hypothetical protein